VHGTKHLADNVDRSTCRISGDLMNPVLPDILSKPSKVPLAPEPKTEKPRTVRPGGRAVEIDIQLQTLDSGKKFDLRALLDSGATGLFLDTIWVRENKISTKRLERARPVYNADGSPNEAGAISEVAEMIIRYGDHTERATFHVTGLGNKNIIVGFPWLSRHNPEINWVRGTVEMTRCPSDCAFKI
jgi:hypothetical protein